MATGIQFLTSRALLSAKTIQKKTGGTLTARTIRKARQGMPAANQRVDDYAKGLSDADVAAVIDPEALAKEEAKATAAA